jgi:hypothetical protein
VREKFPQLTDAQLKGIFMTWNQGQFQHCKSSFTMTDINYQGAMNQAKDVADFLESEAKRAIESYFAKPTP